MAEALADRQTVSLKDALQLVPQFDGHNISLSLFLESCNDAKDMISDAAKHNLTKMF